MQFGAVRILAVLALASVVAADRAYAKEVCVERLSGVCLKYKTVPEAPAATPSRAERAERALGLSRAERQAVQRGLNAAGFYEGAIDGAFGGQSRRALRAWQRANGAPATGFLTADGVAALAFAAPSPANPPSGRAPGFLAACAASNEARAYTIHESGRSIADAFLQAQRAGAACGFPLGAGHGDCIAMAAGPDGEWSRVRRQSRAEGEDAAMRLCRKRKGNTCVLEAVHCSRPAARPAAAPQMRVEAVNFGHYCGVGGRPGEYAIAFSQGSANEARRRAVAPFGMCPYSISLTRGVCIAVTSSDRGAFQVSRKGTEAEARRDALSKCESYDRGPCRVNELVCLR